MKSSSQNPTYNAIKTVVDGIEFASKTESIRYRELKLLEKAGEISNLTLQPEYPLIPAFRKCPICHTETQTSRKSNKCPKCKAKMKTIREMKYIADFKYLNKEGREIIEDVKGSKTYRTDKFRHKEKFFEFLYPDKFITIVVPKVRS